MSSSAFRGFVWEVLDDGKMIYSDGQKVMFEIEPETLTDPDRIRMFRHHPGLNHYEFFLHWIRACEKANVKEVKLILE